MKTIEQVRAEMEFGDVFTKEEFGDLVDKGWFIPSDGVGRFHDGENETNVSVWDNSLTPEDVEKYPYVCWYNK